jgi:hypothetical protein
MKVKEFVKIDQQGEFISAVQLSDFDSPSRNSQLIKTFIFSDATPDSFGMHKKYHGTISLLEKFTNCFKAAGFNPPNALIVLADYGHGKSHFALEAMNYFDKPKNSPEAKIIYDRIVQALPNNVAKAEKFSLFKNEKGRFLVLHLDGTSGKSIKEMLYTAIKNRLAQNFETKDYQLPFWNQDAINWLNEKKNDKRSLDFLAKNYQTDVIGLIKEIESNTEGSWEKYSSLFEELNNGVSPDKGGNKNPKEVINWLIKEFVGDEKLFAGLLIFFDEFSQFVSLYIKKGMDATLKNLLEGITENKQKALLVAFGQHDPSEIAKNSTHDKAVLDNIEKELNRIEKKYNLYSLVESVLDSYLSNSTESWEKLINENSIAKAGFLGDVSEYSWDLYKSRYENELRWDFQKFRNVVVKGCYPLHPTTTGLLASLKMVSDISDDARTMLRFVQKAYGLKKDEEIMNGRKVNWVYPIELIDHFEEKITDPTTYSEFKSALINLQTILSDNTTENHKKILKAMLLQRAEKTRYNYNGYKQIELLSHYCGLDIKESKEILKELNHNNIIKYIEYPGIYMFWPTGVNPLALEKEIQDRLLNIQFDNKYLLKLEGRLRNQQELFDDFKPIELNIDWGHPSDWAAEQRIFTRESLTSENLRKAIPVYEFTALAKDPIKGLVVWCLALHDEDVDYFRHKSKDLLEEAFKTYTTPPPVLLIIPTNSNSEITKIYLRYETLKDMSLSETTKKEFGFDNINNEIQKTTLDLHKKFKEFFAKALAKDTFDNRFVVPKLFYHQVSATSPGFNPIPNIMERLYKAAYAIRPNNFFNDIKGLSNTNVTKATKKISAMLAKRNLREALQINPPTPIEKRLINEYLLNKWKIINYNFYASEPKDHSIEKAWEFLNETIKPDKSEVRLKSIFTKLLNPPYGFDFNTSLLLFSAWVGCYNKEIKFIQDNAEVTIATIFDSFSNYTKATINLLTELCLIRNVAIRREDPSKIKIEIQAVLEKIRSVNQVNINEANSMLIKLQDYVEKESGQNSPLITDCESAISLLTNHLEDLNSYEDAVENIQKSIRSTSDLSALNSVEKKIQNLEYPKFIQTQKPNLADLQKELDNKFEALVDSICMEPLRLSNIENVGVIRNKIQENQKHVSTRNNLFEKLKKALSNLEIKVEELRNKEEEKRYLEQLSLISDHSPLVKLQADLHFIKSQVYPVQLKTKVDEKIDKLSGKIIELQKFAEASVNHYQSISESDLDYFKEKFLKNLSMFTGSSHETKLLDIKDYLNNLDNYYSEIKFVNDFSNLDIHKILANLEKAKSIKEKYMDKLSGDHIGKIQYILDKLIQELGLQKKNFIELLDEVEQILELELKNISNTLSVDIVKNKIKNLQSYNLEEYKYRLEKAGNDLSMIERIMNEKFTVDQIERLFKSLDQEKRNECIERLKNL